MGLIILAYAGDINICLINDRVETIFKILTRIILTPSVVSIFYLLITLIVIVKISFKKMGALRSTKKYDNSKK